MNAPLSPEKIEELKKLKASLGSFQDPDTGTAGRRFPIISEGLVENLVPGVAGRFNLFTHSQQAALESYEAKRLDDGVSGEHRIARVVYYEEKSLQDAVDKLKSAKDGEDIESLKSKSLINSSGMNISSGILIDG